MIFLPILLCWIVSFLFAGIEAGLLSVDPIRLRYQASKKTRAALRLERLLKQPERMLVTVLFVTNLADILGLLLLTRLLVHSLGRGGFLLTIVVALPVYLFLLSVLPKSIFRRFPFRALAALGGLLEAAALLLRPFFEIGERLGRWLLPRRAQKTGVRLFAAREELKQIAVQSEREGSLTSAERAMIHNVVDFRNVTAREVMVPLAKSITARQENSIAEILQLSATTSFDRVPILSREGHAIGVINVLDILLDRRERARLSDYTRRIVTAEENETASRLILRLRAARIGLAAVIDRRKKLIGIVSAEDLIKRIVQNA